MYYPFGEFWNGAGSLGMHQEFALLPDYDPETDQYNTANRHYTPMGRWLTPDPVGGDVTNPQSLNRYAYVLNNPTTLIDPLGLQGQDGYGTSPPGCPQGMPTQYCYGGYPGFAAGGMQLGPLGFSVGGQQTWNEFDMVFAPPYVTGENGDYTWYSGGIDPNGFALLGLMQGGPATLPLSGMGGLLAALTPQIQPAEQNPCTQPILGAVNQTFGTSFTSEEDVQGEPWNTGGAINLKIIAPGLPTAQFNAMQAGRYPLNWWTYLIGYGPTLHVTGQTQFNGPPAEFYNSNIYGTTSVTLTAHIDYGYLFNPFGALYHLFRELLHIGGARKLC